MLNHAINGQSMSRTSIYIILCCIFRPGNFPIESSSRNRIHGIFSQGTSAVKKVIRTHMPFHLDPRPSAISGAIDSHFISVILILPVALVA